MKLHQLSLFLENKPHQLRMPVQLLGKAGLDILTLSLADTQQFGILRIIVDDWQKAKPILESAGCVVKVTEVVAIEVPDRPGGLADVLTIIDHSELNIEYVYSCTFHRNKQAVLVFRFQESIEQVAAVLKSQDVRFVGDDDLRRRSQ
ncbi:MAG: ACT domain-containing protein [Phycisphaerae bacterium]|nr:ACT domain-containing protein [Phycisphaerae bacterium]